MTLKELREYTTLKNDEIFFEVEIKRLEALKAEKISYYSSPQLNAAPGNGNTANTTERLALLSIEYGEKLDKQIKACREALETTRARLEAIDLFIASIQDSEARSMLRRHIKQRASFNQIAREFFVSRNYVARRIKGACK